MVASSLIWFDPQILGFANHGQYIDTCKLAYNYLLICCSNELGLLIKLVEHGEMNKLSFWPNVQFGAEVSRFGVPPWILFRPPRAR